MTRKHLTGLLLAASTMTAGTLAVVNAQDPADDHDHEHTPTTVHAADATAFELTDADAYPDPDGFATMQDRVSYAIGRSDAQQIAPSQPDLDPATYGEGIRKGLAEENEDYALGFSQGFEITRRVLAQRPEEVDMDAFVAGIAAALREEKEDYAFGYTQGYQIAQGLLAQRPEEVDLDTFIEGIAVALKDDNETRSIGYLIGNSYREAELSVVADSYLQGVEEALHAAGLAAEGEDAPQPKMRLTEAQVSETLDAFSEYLNNKQRDEAIAEGQAFIDALKAEDGWTKTESGIAYKVTAEGEGESPDANDVVTAHYEGSLTDGTVFQTSFGGQPFTRAANQLIPGWTEMLQLMKPGATYQIVLPYDMAYGEMGSPPTIPPYATLKFKIELLSFEPVPNADEAPAPAE